MTLKASCLCGGVKFEVSGKPGPIGQCHCSKCRKVSGTDGNAVFHTQLENLSWIRGRNLIKEYTVPGSNDWKSIFCGTCGSPLPHCDESNGICYIPAGLLDDDPGHRGYIGHIYVGSKAPWVKITDGTVQFSEDVGSDKIQVE
jgi:hypothetical protein